MPTTWALPPANRSWSVFSAGASLLQVRVKANAKNASTTRCPRKSASRISRSSWERSVKSGARSPTRRVFVSVATFVRPLGGGGGCCAIVPRLAAVTTDLAKRRVRVDRSDFLAYRVRCPFCDTTVGPRFVTREHLDIPPNPPYAATVRCPKDRESFEVIFEATS